MMQYVIAGIFGILGGLYCLLASILNWNSFFEASKSREFVNMFGRTGARIFYFILGAVIFILGIGLLILPK